MDTIHEEPAVIQPLSKDWYPTKVVAVDMLRLDLLHPVISGNKWYKLKHNVQHALQNGFEQIVTFGGGYSNHLIATAATAKAYGIKAIGMVRGNYDPLTSTLQACKDEGMQLIFISHEDYKQKHEPAWQRNIVTNFDRTLIIPEGGANEWGREGAREIANLIDSSYTHICVSVGTGTTFIGLRNGLASHQQLLGFVPMKGGTYLTDYISQHLSKEKNTHWQLLDRWHFGGFGKWTDEQLAFMNDFYATNNIPLDVVYTGKMMYGAKELIDQDYFPPDAKILCIHTGGLQGNPTGLPSNSL